MSIQDTFLAQFNSQAATWNNLSTGSSFQAFATNDVLHFLNASEVKAGHLVCRASVPAVSYIVRDTGSNDGNPFVCSFDVEKTTHALEHFKITDGELILVGSVPAILKGLLTYQSLVFDVSSQHAATLKRGDIVTAGSYCWEVLGVSHGDHLNVILQKPTF